MLLICSYFLRYLSLNVLINMVLTQQIACNDNDDKKLTVVFSRRFVSLPLISDGMIKVGLSSVDGLLGAILPYYALVQIARFILVWMLIAQVAGEHVLGIFRSAGLLSQ